RLTGSRARALSAAPARSADNTLKSVSRFSCGRGVAIPYRAPPPRYGLALSTERPGHPLPERGCDLGDEPVEVAAQLVHRAEHGRHEHRVDPGGPELIELVADLVRGAGQAGVARVRGVPAHALGDRVGEGLDLVLL